MSSFLAEASTDVTFSIGQVLSAIGVLAAVIVYQEARIRSLTERLITVIAKFAASDEEDKT